MSTHHLDELRLASIASGDAPNSEEEIHLAQCRTCAAVHAELVRLRVQELTEGFAAPAEILVAGHEFVADRIDERVRVPAERRSRVLEWAPALAVAALLLLMVIPFPSGDLHDGVELPDAVRQALIEDSASHLVHPLVANGLRFDAPALRGHDAPVDDRTLEELRIRAEKAPGSASAAASLVAACQAADELRNAREFLDRALEDHPDDITLQRLAIDQDYRESNLTGAEEALRARVHAAPGDHLARLNLAIVLRELGDERESRDLASAVAENLGETGMGLRARELATAAPK